MSFSPLSTVASLASCSLASLFSPTLWVPSQDLVRGVDIWFAQTQPIPAPASSFVLLSCCLLDCEQSLFFSSVSHARERASSGEAAGLVKRGLSRLAPSVTRACILPVLFYGLRKKRDCSQSVCHWSSFEMGSGQ